MDLTKPHRSLGMGVTGDVLVALAALRAPLSGRRIADRAEVSATQAAKVLHALAESGLVDTTNARPAILYELNRDHVLAPVIDAVVAARRAWRQRLRDAVEDWALPPVAVAVFGSSVSGVAHEGSDIDVLVVRPDRTDADEERWSTQVVDMARALTRWTGNHVDVVDSTVRELAANPRLLDEVHNHGDVVVGTLPASIAPPPR